MSLPVFCTGTFVGQRIFDDSIERNNNEITLTLSLTPTKEYPSVFGAGLYQSFSSIIHGIYDGTTRQVSMNEIIDGKLSYTYRCQLTIDQSNGNRYLYGTWTSTENSNLFGKLAMIGEGDNPSNILSGMWIGEAIPDEELTEFYLPVNPIRWCATLYRTNESIWKFFGCGYFNDSADIPNQPLLFYSLEGQGTLEDMTLIKRYTTTDYSVEYRGKFVEYEKNSYEFVGRWTNSLAGSFGSFVAKQRRLDPSEFYRLDLCICEVCRNVLHPGDNRWCCFPCHFSTCHGCHLNSLALNHQHQLMIDILPNQNKAKGKTSLEFLENAFRLFHSSPLILYRHSQTNQLISITYEQMSSKCQLLRKYFKQFIPNGNDHHRPIILFIADTSPAYISCLLTGILVQSVLYPINGSLSIDAIEYIRSTTNPAMIIIGEQYLEKVLPILSKDQQKSSIVIYQQEEQLDQIQRKMNHEIISLTEAMEIGEKIDINVNPSCDLSIKTISAILSTSGSTGYPKGAIFTEELLIPNDTFTLLSPYIRVDYQPYDPVLLLSLLSTIQYGSSRGLTNLNDMWMDIRRIRPTSLGLTPSLWNFIYKNYLWKCKENSLEKEMIVEQMREELGGRVFIGTTGGGSISPTVLSFIRNQLKIDLVDIYGCRECGNISKNGIIYPGIDVQLIPVSEFDGISQGEICVHSPKLIQGYWNNPNPSSFIQLNNKLYYRTGDIGYLQGKSIKLLDRSGMMIKNSMGEWISPVSIENIIEQLPEISMAFVMGHSDQSYLIGIICPSKSGLMFNEIDLLQLIRFHCVHCGLKGSEIPQRIYIEQNLIWNRENGFFKEKKSRHALTHHYSKIRDNLFNETPQIHSNDLNKDFIQILENLFNRSLTNSITGENTLLQIGANSLIVSVICQYYQKKGIDLHPANVYHYSLNHLQQILMNPNCLLHSIVEQINWREEATLPKQLIELISKTNYSEKKAILLIGATGFLGPILLHEILDKTDENILVYCLIRGNDHEHIEQRLKQDLQKCKRFNPIHWKRIRCLLGDVSHKSLGLSDDLTNELSQQIGLIYHNASHVNLRMSYQALKSSNVQGTLNALEFALKCQARFVYTSSTAALSTDEEDANGWIDVSFDEIDRKDGYGQTKVIVEQLLKKASNLGMEIVIIRPGTISADTQTGYSNVNDFLNILIQTQIQLKSIVDQAKINFHLIPVDFCAKIIVALAMNSQSQGKCFNLIGNPLNISTIDQILSRRFSLKKIPQNQWRDLVLNNSRENTPGWIIRDQLASMEFLRENTEQPVSMKMTKDFLENHLNIPWLEINEEHFIQSIDFLIQHKFLEE